MLDRHQYGAVMSERRVVTSTELQQHGSNKDCWLAIHGKVYDITTYLVDHPGGDDVMLEHAGAPASFWFLLHLT